MNRGLQRLATLAIAAAAATGLTACATGPSSPAPVSTGGAAATGAGEPAQSAKPTPSGPPTCEGIIPTATVDAFTEVGWTAQEQPLQIGDLKLAGGIECHWADFSVASDNMQIYGWAPITAEQAKTARAALEATGWHTLKDSGEGVYVTEDESTAAATDDEGFGMTYLFGDGWVKLADTKQGLLLIDWPPS